MSSHTGIDDKPNLVGEYVTRSNKAWTAANANPYSIQTELCAFAKWGPSDWGAHSMMLSNCAQWIAEEAANFGIPLVKLNAQQAQSGSAGVCGHVDLGTAGGNHWDPGPSFPWDQVMAMAGGSAPIPPPQPGGPAPPFPYPASDYLGEPSSDPHCHSGYYGGVDQSNVSTWQAQMAARGWGIAVDGMFGPSSSSIAAQFQSEKGLSADGLVGPQTWAATWTAPVT